MENTDTPSYKRKSIKNEKEKRKLLNIQFRICKDYKQNPFKAFHGWMDFCLTPSDKYND